MALTKIILYVTDDELVIFEWKDETIVSSRRFTRDGMGIVEYGKFLNENLEIPYSILVNTVEEEYKLETMPYVPKRQKKLLERHILKQYRGNEFKYGVIQGRETFGKKDAKILLAAIGDDLFLKAWIEPLLSRKISISGINSVPLLAEYFVKKLNVKIKKLLVVTRDKATIRLTYLEDDNFKISRSVKTDGTHNAEEVVQEILDEIDKTLLYLGRIRLVFPDQKIEVLIISSSNICQSLKLKNTQINNIEKWIYCDNDYIRNALEQHRDIMEDEFLVVELYIHTLFSFKTINHYATTAHTKYYKSRSLRRPLELISATFLVMLSLLSAVLFIDSQVLDVRISKIKEEINHVDKKLTIAKGSLPVYPITADVVKSSVRAVDILISDQPDIERSLIVLSEILSKFSNVELRYLKWSVVEREAINSHIQEVEKTVFEDSTEMADVEVAGEVEKQWVQVLNLGGHLNNFNGNYVAANKSVDELVHKLNSDKHFASAIATKKPISNQPDKKINGATGKKMNQGTIAEFSLEIIIDESAFS